MEFKINIFIAVVIAAILYWLGDWLVSKIGFLKRYCIPPPLVGGLLFALANTWLYASGTGHVTFDPFLQNFLMLVFFTAVGFTARVPLLKRGGKAVIRCLVLASILTLGQNVLGAVVLKAMGEDPRLGLAVGSISLVGGPGTAAAFGPELEAAGAAGGLVIGMAAATFGLVAGSVFGGPTAERLIRRNGIAGAAGQAVLDEQTQQSQRPAAHRYFVISVIILFCVLSGSLVSQMFVQLTGLTMPGYIGAMCVAALLRNTTEMPDEEFPDNEADIIGNFCLCGFLTMTMMSLKVWELADLAGPLVVALALQTILLLSFSAFVFFPQLGRDYDAAVMTAGFIGFSMGATSNAMANMQAVTRRFGPCPTAFLVIPTVGGMFIDFVNAIAISLMIPLLGMFV